MKLVWISDWVPFQQLESLTMEKVYRWTFFTEFESLKDQNHLASNITTFEFGVNSISLEYTHWN